MVCRCLAAAQDAAGRMGRRGIGPRNRTCSSSSPKNAKLAFTSSSVTFKYVELKPAMAPWREPESSTAREDRTKQRRVRGAAIVSTMRMRTEMSALRRAHCFDIDLVRRRWDVRVERVGDPHLQSHTLHSHTNHTHSLRARPLTAVSMGTNAAVVRSHTTPLASASARTGRSHRAVCDGM